MQHPNKTFRWLTQAVSALLFAMLLSGLFGPASVPAKADEVTPTPEQQKALDRINYYRALAGVPPAHLDPALMQSASSHANYVKLNGWSETHNESAGKPGFTGADMQDRAEHFGYKGWVNEDMAAIGEPVAAVDGLMNTVSHRTPILEPAYTDIGYGFATGKNAVDVISFGSTTGKYTYNPPIIQFPPDNFASFGTTFWGESPNIFSGVSFPIGNPVTLTYRGTGKMELVPEESQLVGADGAKIDSVTAVGTTYTTRATYIIAARKPLAKNATYTVTMTYKIDGNKESRTWSFTTGPLPPSGTNPTPAPTTSPGTSPGPSPSPAPTTTPTVAPKLAPLPAGLAKAPAAIGDLWRKVDGTVGQSQSTRTWLYGPDVNKSLTEIYSESPANKRNVWYFDKARLEITQPSGDTSADWYVTSGLLPKELMSNQIQVGNNNFVAGPGAAKVVIAGDVTNNPDAPTYQTFSKVSSLNNDKRAPNRVGMVDQEMLTLSGQVVQATPAVNVRYAYYDSTLGHNVADVFMNSFKTLPKDWLYIVGLPLSEPYWTRVKVKGVDRDVLVQAFERRVLTYTPTNTPQWQVEMGNVGLHYQLWRYGGANTVSSTGN
jgi:uncharacterized protein YkwD